MVEVIGHSSNMTNHKLMVLEEDRKVFSNSTLLFVRCRGTAIWNSIVKYSNELTVQMILHLIFNIYLLYWTHTPHCFLRWRNGDVQNRTSRANRGMQGLLKWQRNYNSVMSEGERLRIVPHPYSPSPRGLLRTHPERKTEEVILSSEEQHHSAISLSGHIAKHRT